MTDDFINKVFKQATGRALVGWDTYLSAEEIIQELWIWYLARPSVQKKFEELSRGELVKLVRRHVFQILAGETKATDMFEGRSLYSSDNVKDALTGETTNRYLVDILPLAMKGLDASNGSYAEAIRVRYDDGVIPPRQSTEQVYLSRAVKSLTEHVNIIAFMAGLERDADGNLIDKQGPGSRAAVFPETRKVRGEGHSDPTANIAILLIEHPEVRDDYLYEQSLPEFLGGRCHAQPA